jgi:ATP-binding cassette subfamily C (CFTR/MRP) protein 1
LSEFLKADELQPGARNLVMKTLREGDEVYCRFLIFAFRNTDMSPQVLSIANGEFSWSKQAAVPTLENVNLTVKKGELWGVFGRVGAGKVVNPP